MKRKNPVFPVPILSNHIPNYHSFPPSVFVHEWHSDCPMVVHMQRGVHPNLTGSVAKLIPRTMRMRMYLEMRMERVQLNGGTRRHRRRERKNNRINSTPSMDYHW